MLRRPPICTHTDSPIPYTTLFRTQEFNHYIHHFGIRRGRAESAVYREYVVPRPAQKTGQPYWRKMGCSCNADGGTVWYPQSRITCRIDAGESTPHDGSPETADTRSCRHVSRDPP